MDSQKPIESTSSTLMSVLYAVLIAAAVAGATTYLLPRGEPVRTSAPATKPAPTAVTPAATTAATTPAAPRPQWDAAAPGRVEPIGGEVRIGALAPGRIVEVAVAPNERVLAGDLLVRLNDEDAIARLNAAEAEAAVRKRERDAAEPSPGRLVQDRRNAEDAVATAERELSRARADRDAAVVEHRRANDTDTRARLDQARKRIRSAEERLESDRAALRRAMSAQGLPLPTRLDAGLIAARAELSLADAALERTRIRAPADGTVLNTNARVGEIVAPSPDQVLVTVGDTRQLRVRAEVEERDAARIRNAQRVVVRTDAYPGRDFEGTVSMLAPALGPSRLAQRGPRRPNDFEVMEVLIDLDGQPPLLPGMRVDVLFRPVATASESTRRAN